MEYADSLLDISKALTLSSQILCLSMSLPTSKSTKAKSHSSLRDHPVPGLHLVHALVHPVRSRRSAENDRNGLMLYVFMSFEWHFSFLSLRIDVFIECVYCTGPCFSNYSVTHNRACLAESNMSGGKRGRLKGHPRKLFFASRSAAMTLLSSVAPVAFLCQLSEQVLEDLGLPT